MVVEFAYVSIPMRLTVGSVSFASVFSELMSCSRNLVICWTLFRPMLPDESTANTMSDPLEQSTDSSRYLTFC